MYYKKSAKVLKLIKQSQNILINLHKNPDLDSFSSALAMAEVVRSLGKKATIISSQKVDWRPAFFPNREKIVVINFNHFDFSKYDLFIILDSSSYDRVSGDKKIFLPKISIIVIDHHQSNRFPQKNKLVDVSASATTEIIYRLFADWEIKIDNKIADCLLAGILGDTVCLKYPKNAPKTLAVVSDLLTQGADYQKIVGKIYDQLELSLVRTIGAFIQKIRWEKTGSGKKFVWAAVDHKEFVRLGKVSGGREAAADIFFRSIKDADFGVAILEVEKGRFELSFRSKPGVDVSQLAHSFGGGGHKNAAGATFFQKSEELTERSIKKIIKKIIAVA